MRNLYGALEAGGTKFICGVGSFEAGSREQVRIDTSTPDETISQVLDFFRVQIARHGPLAGLGIGSFGPLDLDPGSSGFGSLTTTPKPGWQGVDLQAWVARGLGVPVTINTDVNTAAFAEARLAFSGGPGLLAYVTVGTGIGVGFAESGGILARRIVPEAGHLSLRRVAAHGSFSGVCPFHSDCLEGLASGPAIKAAWGASLDELSADHPAWTAEADYIAQLCAALLLMVSPDRIVLGGGVFNQHALYGPVRVRTLEILGGYRPDLRAEDDLVRMITPPASTTPPGLSGAYLLAEQA